MNVADTALTPRLQRLVELLRSVSGTNDPVQIQREFSSTMAELDPVGGYVSVSVRGLEPGEYKITGRLYNDEQRRAGRGDVWSRFKQIPTHRGGFIGRIIENPIPQVYENLNVTDDPALGDEIAEYDSVVAAPLFDEGEALNWGILLKREPGGFQQDEIERFFMRGNLIGRMTKNLIMRREVETLNERLQKQLEEIAQIQRSLLPQRTPSVPGLSMATSYLTSDEAGGDYYDFFEFDDGRFGVLIADVAGHGAGAATVMAMLQTILHSFPLKEAGPAAMLAHANSQLAQKRMEASFVTAWLGFFSPDRRSLTYSNAGHNHPMRRREPGVVEVLKGAGSLPLGIIEDCEYEEAEVTLDLGDSIVLYTDGINEAFSPQPDREMFGTNRLEAAIIDCSGRPGCVIESIHERLYAHTQARSRDDDQTIVALRVDDESPINVTVSPPTSKP
ncbi:MAG: PP2C family protein-serine/threonine phosphatase [Planctomycetota bacterium]